MEAVYLDHAATTPMVPEAIAALTEQLTRTGNASSLHAAGRAARRVVEESRERIAAVLGAHPGEVVFTSGGTEADNLALKGLFWRARAADPRRTRVLVSAIEHHAVLDPALWLAEHEHAQVELLPVDTDGRLRIDALAEALAADPGSVAVVSVMAANNEVGTLQPVAEVVELARAQQIPVHVDAVQAAGHRAIDFAGCGADALTVTGHKLGGPYGVGALLLRRGLDATALLHGGGQERDVRSGTLDPPAIAAFAAALVLAEERRTHETARLEALRTRLVDGILARVPDARVNGDPDPAGRLPHIAHLSFPGCEGDSLLMLLDAQQIACSTGSACSAGVPQASHVLLAMGREEDEARSSLRFSLGHTSTGADIDRVLAEIVPVVERARAAGALSAARRSLR